jgi:WD40 repeat protein
VLTSWVTQMRFNTESDALIAACANGYIYFVDVLRGAVLREYASHSSSRAGVRTFSWSAFNKYVVSGADRTILFWDLFTLETVHKIENLKSPVVTVDVQDEQNKVFAILSNKAIFVWHNVTYELLQTVMDTTSYKPLNALTMMAFAPDLKVLFTAGHKITSWTLER